MRLWAVLAAAPLAAAVSACSSVRDFIVTPTASGVFTVARDYETVFNSVKTHALQCYEEKDYDHKTTIKAQLSGDRKVGDISVVTRGIDATKYTMHIGLNALGPNETEVKVRDLSVSQAARRLESLKAAAQTGSAACL